MGIIDPKRSFSGDPLGALMAGEDAWHVELGPRAVLARLWGISSAIFPRTDWKSPLRRLGFMLLVLPHLKRIGRWLRCRGNPALSAEMQSSPLVYRAIHRPYVNKNWNLAQRLQAIDQHYLTLLDRAALLDIADTQYFDLLRLGPEYLDLRIVIDRPRWLRGEGELSVSLFHQEHRIYSAMFLIVGEPDYRRLVIGAFQGWGNAGAREIYVRLTRALHGMRPRDLLVNILKMVAANVGCIEIWGIADAYHRGAHALVRCGKNVSYDEVWAEHGGKQNSQGFFVMTAELRLKECAEVPSKKRAQYRRRRELIEDMQSRIRHSFATGERHVLEHRLAAGSDRSGFPPPPKRG